MNKNKQILAYLAKEHPSASITVLVKLSYLADLISTKRTGNKISNFEYIRYHYGPFTQDIYPTIEDLVQSNVLVPKNNYNGADEYVTYTVNTDNDISFDLIDENEKSILDEMINQLRGYGAKTLTEIAYKTKPMMKLGATLGGTEGLLTKLDLSA